MTERGCGTRPDDSLYACVDASASGKDITFFLVDPVVAWNGPKTLRAPMIVQDRQKIKHVIMGVGKAWYPFVPDFVEEAQKMGVSKKLPRNFDLSGSTPGKTKLLLMHPRAIANFPFKIDYVKCPKGIEKPHNCIGALWHLSALKDFGDKHHVERDYEVLMVKITTPSVSYYVSEPIKPKEHVENYQAGVFLAFQNWHFEYVNRKRRVPSKLSERIKDAGFRLDVMET